MVNDFLSKMTDKVFGRLYPLFRTLDIIPLRKAYKGEKCYIGDIEDTGFYKATFIAGLRLPFHEIHHRLTDHLNISVCQIAPNDWRIFIGTEVL